MSAKEIKALIEIGTSLGYSGEELKQFITEERMTLDKEKERRTSGERETNRTGKITHIWTWENSFGKWSKSRSNEGCNRSG